MSKIETEELKKAVKWLNIIFKDDQEKVKVILDGFDNGIIEPSFINQSVDEHLQILNENYHDPEEVKDTDFCEYMVGDFFYGKWYQFKGGVYHQVKSKLDFKLILEKITPLCISYTSAQDNARKSLWV